MKLGRALAIGAAFLASAAPASAVTFTGPPKLVARAERWQHEAHIPLGNEPITLSSTQLCTVGNPPGCSFPGTSYARPRWAFYYELGHQFDWSYLTDADRQWLATKWGVSTATWADSIAGLDQGVEDGLEGEFPTWFEFCALGVPTRRTHVHTWSAAPATRSGSFNVCSYIRYLTTRAYLP